MSTIPTANMDHSNHTTQLPSPARVRTVGEK